MKYGVDHTGSGTQWRWMGARNISEWGAHDKTNIVAYKGGPQQVEFRNDCHGAKWLYTDISEIYPGQRA